MHSSKCIKYRFLQHVTTFTSIHYMVSSVSRQDEPNHALPTHHGPWEKFSPKPNNTCKSFTDQAFSRWLDIDLIFFLRVYETQLCLSPETLKNELGQYPAILTKKVWSITHINMYCQILNNQVWTDLWIRTLCSGQKPFTCLPRTRTMKIKCNMHVSPYI